MTLPLSRHSPDTTLERIAKKEVTKRLRLRHIVAGPSDLFQYNVVRGISPDFAPDSLAPSVQY
jgi:hypothetical protein